MHRILKTGCSHKIHKYTLFSLNISKHFQSNVFCMFSIYGWSNQITLPKTVLTQTTGVGYCVYSMWEAVSLVYACVAAVF